MTQDYDLELERVAKEIRDQKARKVLIQLGDGLKPRAMEIQESLSGKTDAQIYFWMGSCYGKCDIPEIIDNKKGDFDLLVQFGH
jgi:diphthamide biosynthesis enzyme Dph1/Dph2-like protein